jgi:hypothetical protein
MLLVYIRCCWSTLVLVLVFELFPCRSPSTPMMAVLPFTYLKLCVGQFGTFTSESEQEADL